MSDWSPKSKPAPWPTEDERNEAEVAALRAQVAELTKERDKGRAEILEWMKIATEAESELASLKVDAANARVGRDKEASARMEAEALNLRLREAVELKRHILREIVDEAWNVATESDAVPSTDWADRIIDKALGLSSPQESSDGS